MKAFRLFAYFHSNKVICACIACISSISACAYSESSSVSKNVSNWLVSTDKVGGTKLGVLALKLTEADEISWAVGALALILKSDIVHIHIENF